MPGPKNNCPRLWRIPFVANRENGVHALRTRKGAGHRRRLVFQSTYIDVLGKALWRLEHTSYRPLLQ